MQKKKRNQKGFPVMCELYDPTSGKDNIDLFSHTPQPVSSDVLGSRANNWKIRPPLLTIKLIWGWPLSTHSHLCTYVHQ